MPGLSYTGSEAAIDLPTASSPDADSWFELRPPTIPHDAVPIYDESLGAVIGYRHAVVTGVYKLYDLEGTVVGMEERGLESPLLDPLDLIFFAGGVFRALGRGAVTGATRTAPRVAATAAGRLSARGLAVAVLGAMRTAFRRVSAGQLRFTATTAARMATPGRYVPIHILHLVIRFGKRAPDPQGVKGAFLYTAKMLKNGKEYALEVVVRESDWTILHFLYR